MNLFAKDTKYGILVNKENPLSRDDVPEGLVPVKSKVTSFIDPNHQLMLNPAALAGFEELQHLMAKYMFDLQVSSGYRSYDCQELILAHNLREKGEAAYKTVALPGSSEHQTGLALDYVLYSQKPRSEMGIAELVLFKAKLEAAHILVMKNAHKCGLIARYQKGMEQVTGFAAEPWHLRFFGHDEARNIYNKGVPYEQYVSQAGGQKR